MMSGFAIAIRQNITVGLYRNVIANPTTGIPSIMLCSPFVPALPFSVAVEMMFVTTII
jgi:hypothetical protein